MKKYILPYLVLLSALLLAVTAAYFSISGLSKLFSGSAIAVIIMAGVLEFSKIVSTAFLHKFWKSLQKSLKIYLTTGVIVLSIITSIGIYGFLSSAYSITSAKLDKQNGGIQILSGKKELFENNKQNLQLEIQSIDNRINQLVSLRNQQESRIDSLYKRGLVATAKNVEKNTKSINEQIETLDSKIESVQNEISVMNDSINGLSISIIESSNSDVSSELGPLRFISNILGVEMDYVVNFLILMLVFVFDPLAICLVIASNMAFSKVGKEDAHVESEPIFSLPLPDKIFVESAPETLPVEINKLDVSPVTTEEPEVLDEPINEELVEVTPETLPVKVYSGITSLDSVIKNLSSDSTDNQEILGEPTNDQDVPAEVHEFNEGGFLPTDEMAREEEHEPWIPTQISKTDIYMNALFDDGKVQAGDNIPPYNQFVSSVGKHASIDHEDIRQFLLFCKEIGIVKMEGDDRKALVNLEDARMLISQ